MSANKKYSRAVFIFRRDLRLQDNTALLEAAALSEEILPVFIFDPRQIERNSYFSKPAFAFMLQSLRDLDAALKKRGARLYYLKGNAPDVVARLLSSSKSEAVFFNKDYTPFSVERDLQLAEVCRRSGVSCHSSHDTLLNAPDDVNKIGGGIYTVFTPYFKKASSIPVASSRPLPAPAKFSALKSLEGEADLTDPSHKPSFSSAICGGRTAALVILKNMKQHRDYASRRDLPSLGATTLLSAHLKFGTVSAREVYAAITHDLGPAHPLLRQLYWRDFFTQIGYHHPYVLGRAFNEKYDKIVWENNEEFFAAWCEGRTGYPIVDAGMRELNATGYMHNRVRMITASFLVKDLHINWRWGEKYFAQRLVDYDPLVNNGNWQWAASTGCDAQPYFRVFNPWLQTVKFDPRAEYIKKWVPELSGLTAEAIHRLLEQPLLRPRAYPPPVVDHRDRAEKAKAMFRAC